MNAGPTLSIRPDSERAPSWRAMFGRLDNIPVTGYVPVLADLPDRPESAVYMLDLARITPDERARLVQHIVARFHIPETEVEWNLDHAGCPILALDTTGPAIPLRLIV